MSEVYRFSEGAATYRYTSADHVVTFPPGHGALSGETYTPIAIGRTEPEDKSELAKANLQITVSIDNTAAKSWLSSLREMQVELTIFDIDEDTSDVMVIWKGRLSGIKPDVKSITMSFESIYTSLRRTGLGLVFQRNCPHVLYRKGCNVNPEDFKETLTATAHLDDTITVPGAGAFSAGYFTGGMVKLPGTSTIRYITKHSGTTITLIRKMDDLNALIDTASPVSIEMFPGCDRSKEMCASRFSNIENHGGFPFIPLKNPMDGSSIV